MSEALAVQYVPIAFRPPTEDEMAFIYSGWLRSHRYSRFAVDIPGPIYFDNHKKVVELLLSTGRIVVACNPDHPDQLFGFVCYQPTHGGAAVMHYLYVKQPFRRFGIATAMYRHVQVDACHDPGMAVVATHLTEHGAMLRDKWGLVFNPYVIGAFE